MTLRMKWILRVFVLLTTLASAIPSEPRSKELAVRAPSGIEIFEPQISSPITDLEKRLDATFAGVTVMAAGSLGAITCFKPAMLDNRYAQFIAVPGCVLALAVLTFQAVFAFVAQFTNAELGALLNDGMIKHLFPPIDGGLSSREQILLNYIEGGPALEVARMDCSGPECLRAWYMHETNATTGQVTRKFHVTPGDVDIGGEPMTPGCRPKGTNGFECDKKPKSKTGKQLFGGYEFREDDSTAFNSLTDDSDFTFHVVQHMNFFADSSGFFKTEGIWCVDLTTTKFGADKGTDGAFWQFFDPAEFADLDGKHDYLKTCSKVKP